ncbi:MAG: TetR/AcrR family transcriptional regulator [Leptospiraceae bacterium]|nr:TetR/AcrR family transcriptional regulator [Leptospiraceae bacterium]
MQKLPVSLKNRRSRNSLSQNEILDAAAIIISEEGVVNLSMRRIAKKLECSVASPYAHFASLEEICVGLIIRGEELLVQKLKIASKKGKDTYEQLFELAKAYWSFALEHRELHKLMFSNSESGGILFSKALGSVPRSYRVFLNTFRKGMKTGQFNFSREDYPAFCKTIWTWIYGLITLEMAGIKTPTRKGNTPLDEGLHILKDLFDAKVQVSSRANQVKKLSI